MPERGIVYICPECDKAFDSPSVCMPGGETAEPRLMSVTREQHAKLKHTPGYGSSPAGHGDAQRTNVFCRCGWMSATINGDPTPELLEAIFAEHVGIERPHITTAHRVFERDGVIVVDPPIAAETGKEPHDG